MRVRPGRSRREAAGQALAEYGILLALVSGASWIRQLSDRVLAEPYTALLIGAGAVVVLGFLFSGNRR